MNCAETGWKSNRQILLTGSANIMALPKLSDPLVGRMRILTLYPFSCSEVLGSTGCFIDRLFDADFQRDDGKHKLTELIRLATFPEISGAHSQECSSWFDSYITTILQRDVRTLAEIENSALYRICCAFWPAVRADWSTMLILLAVPG
ncbi:MAG: ATP-binding protein [Burkholderiales bacterium]|nr:ATP-binding protein [Burkholderiales bacterium]